MAKLVRAKKRTFGDWGYVEGRWVYIPLWDPSPIDKQFRGYKQLYLANALNDIASKVTNPNIAGKLKSMTKELISGASKSGLISYEDGDGICPDWWPWPWPGPRPNYLDVEKLIIPAFFPNDLNNSVANLIAGQLLHNLGEQLKMPQLQEMGKVIMG